MDYFTEGSLKLVHKLTWGHLHAQEVWSPNPYN